MSASRFSSALVLLGLLLIDAGDCLADSDGWYADSTSDVSAFDFFTADEIAEAKEYRLERLGFSLGGLVLNLAFWGSLFGLGLARRLDAVAGRLSRGRFWLRCACFLALVFTLRALVFHPLAYAGYLHRAEAGLSNQSAFEWHVDRLGFLVTYLGLFASAVFVVYLLLRRTPRWWWVWSSAGAAAVIVLGMYVYPQVIAPIFNDFRPLEDGPLKERLLELSRGSGISVQSIHVMDASRRSPHANAYFAGLGASRRIVLYDTLLEAQTDEEVASVLAHEIGHWKRSHTWKGALWAIGGSVALLWFLDRVLSLLVKRKLGGIDTKWSLVGMPALLLVMSLTQLLAAPIENSISRGMEREADDEELRLTGDPDRMISSLRKMAITNRTDVEPHPIIEWWLFSHPSTMNRIRRAIYEKRALEARTSASGS